MLRAALALLSIFFATAAQSVEDCRIRTLPPAAFASKPMPPVNHKGLRLAELQKLYRHFAGLPPRAAGMSYCADPLGFVYPWHTGETPTIYFPTDVSERCKAEVLAHEGAHVKGWPIDHPGGRVQRGTCQGARGTP
jgi:hypothetical protein